MTRWHSSIVRAALLGVRRPPRPPRPGHLLRWLDDPLRIRRASRYLLRSRRTKEAAVLRCPHDWTAQKNVVDPGTAEADVLTQSINEIPYTPTGEGLQETLNAGNVYTYEQRFGGAELYSGQGKVFVPTRSFGLPSNYLGSQLAHEYFHVLSYRFTGLSGSEVFANRFGEVSSYIGPSRARILATYPTAADLYRAVIKGPLTY